MHNRTPASTRETLFPSGCIYRQKRQRPKTTVTWELKHTNLFRFDGAILLAKKQVQTINLKQM